MTKMVETSINGKWNLTLPDYRARRPEWVDWETARLNSICERIKPTDFVLDIGTEEGDMSALVASWCAGIILFEPNPRVWTTIRKIWEANNIKTPISYFVGFASNRTEINPPKNNVRSNNKDGWPECAYNRATARHGDRRLTRIKNNTTPQTKIDDWLTTPVNVIMIDVDGAELEVLKGAEQTLRNTKPLVYVSVHPDYMQRHFGQFELELHDFMKTLGYKGTHLGFDHEHHWLYEVES